jgi:hypothetical protein
VFGVITVKRSLERIQSRVRIQQPGFQKARTEQKEPIAINADTTQRLGMMAALGIFVRNKNTDKGNRR